MLGDYFEAVKTDYTTALQIYKANCDDSKHFPSCHKAATYIINGRGSKRKISEVYKYLSKACEYGSTKSCYMAGKMHMKDPKDSTDIPLDYEKVCNILPLTFVMRL